MKRNRFPAGVALMLALSVLALPSAALAGPPTRPATWASAVSATGVGNLYRVEPDLYRSAQPTGEGFRELEALGIKSVLSVSGQDDTEAAKGTKLKLFHVSMTAWGLKDRSVLKALEIMADPKNRPLVIHCQHGADRTGALIAMYRSAVQGWSKEEAVREMAEGGFHHNSFWRNLDQYVLAADVAAIRSKLGTVLAARTPSAPNPVVAAAAAAATAVTLSAANQ